MEFVVTPYTRGNTGFGFWENAFNAEELNYLQITAKNAEEDARVGGHDGPDLNTGIRRTKLKWLNYNSENDWLYRRLSHVVSSLNALHFNFDISGFGEPIQLTNYESSVNGTYNWHQDFSPNVSIGRKLSIILQLTDASEYDGGNLEIMTHRPNVITKQRGTIVAFPSWTTHRVTPVTAGSRQSLVLWASGPSFK